MLVNTGARYTYFNAVMVTENQLRFFIARRDAMTVFVGLFTTTREFQQNGYSLRILALLMLKILLKFQRGHP